MINKILKLLISKPNYAKLLDLAKETNVVNKQMLNIFDRENERNKQKLIYLLIKKANEINPKLQLHENNYLKKIASYNFATKVEKAVIKENFTTHPKVEFEATPEIDAILPEEISKEEYTKWFNSIPSKLQKLILEKGKLTRKRGKLHTEAKKIEGNSATAIEKRKVILDEMTELTLKIKQIHSIEEHYKLTGKLIVA